MKKIAICPKCNTKIFCEGESGQKKIVQCENCGGKGYISFAKEDKKRTLEDLESKISKKLYHKIVIGGKESEENILKKLELKRLKKEGKGELKETIKPFIGVKDKQKQKEQELIIQEHEKKEEERTRKIEARNTLITP